MCCPSTAIPKAARLELSLTWTVPRFAKRGCPLSRRPVCRLLDHAWDALPRWRGRSCGQQLLSDYALGGLAQRWSCCATSRVSGDAVRVSETGKPYCSQHSQQETRGSMTQHRFIRCSSSAVLETAYSRHNLHDGRTFDTIQHWRRPAESERGNALHWYDHVPGIGEVGCCLAVDQGANGAVAHLTATASSGQGGLPRPLLQLALSSWSYRQLVGLAKTAEAQFIDLS
jgi:hypothetical protein